MIRRKSSYPYKNKSYYYYSLEVTDKPFSSRAKFVRNYSPDLFLIGSCKDKNAAKKILNGVFPKVFGAGLGAILSASGYKVAGAAVKVVIGGISKLGTPTVSDIYTNSREFFKIENVSVATTMKYYWVKYKGRWEFAYSCDKTVWNYQFNVGKWNSKKRCYNYSNSECYVKNNGTYYKPYKAIAAIVDYKKLHGDKASMGYDPYGYYKTRSYTIQNTDKKKLRVFSPLFVKRTIDLM